ncbi:hypothetical protein MRX96_039946 [Rhipicephalus microplus]
MAIHYETKPSGSRFTVEIIGLGECVGNPFIFFLGDLQASILPVMTDEDLRRQASANAPGAHFRFPNAPRDQRTNERRVKARESETTAGKNEAM